MVVSTVSLEGPTPISISGDPVLDVMTLVFQRLRRGKVGFSMMNDGDERRNLKSRRGRIRIARICDIFFGGPWIPFI